MPREPPNVLHLFLDELRADVLGCYDHPFVETPNIDRIADRGVVFENAYSNCPFCAPTRAAMATALYPHQNGIVGLNAFNNTLFDSVSEPIFDFHNHVRDCGYDRVVNVGKHHVPGVSPAEAGFDEHVPVEDGLGANPSTPPAGVDESAVIRSREPPIILSGVHPDTDETLTARVVEETLDRIDRADAPWYVRMSLNRPHTPVMPPESFASRYAEQADLPPYGPENFEHRPPILRDWAVHRDFGRYDAEQLRRIRQHYYGLVSFVDDRIGRLLDHLEATGQFENTLIVFHSDHGSSIGDGGLQVKGPHDTRDIARVPLLFSWPEGLPEGQRHAGPVQLLDFNRTLLDLLDGTVPDRYEGASLRPALEDDERVHDRVFAEGQWGRVHAGNRETVWTDEWRYTRYASLGQDELVATDTPVPRDVSADHPAVVERLDAAIDAWVDRTPPITRRTDGRAGDE